MLGVGGETPSGLVRAMADSYRDDAGPAKGQILHRPREQRLPQREAAAEGGEDGEKEDVEVAYTSTQALWSAVVRAADLESERAAAVGGADVPALQAWYGSQRQRESGLLPVANVYETPRLWANTEWAAFVLLNKDIFVGNA